MALEIIHGETQHPTVAQALVNQLESIINDGTLYLGYPVLATADEQVNVDALLISQDRGIVAFLLEGNLPADEEEKLRVRREQDKLYAVLEGYLSRHEGLRDGRQVAVLPGTATLFASPIDGFPQANEDSFYGPFEEVGEWIAGRQNVTSHHYTALEAAFQRVTTIKPFKKRQSVVRPDSRGGILKEIEKGIANLDRWQKAAAIETPEGPQRIRGLAGSGKTVVLALKAAYLHSRHPEWDIALTFHSRALYQQMDDLVDRFTFEHTNDRRDPKRLQIVHAWGSPSKPGIYSQIASALGQPARDWSYARGKYGMDDGLKGICRELLEVAEGQNVDPLFDAVLIDEAQDLPPEFFRLVYLFTKEPKRIVWGFDELQKLSESAMPTTDELFGVDAHGAPVISLDHGPNDPRRDIVLPICYRNSPWALATAHALGLGIYSPNGIVQHPDRPSLWQDIGYRIDGGSLESGSQVVLRRSESSYPEYFPRLLEAEDSVYVEGFETEGKQDAWVASQIKANIEEEELEADDILIVLPASYTAKSRASRLIRALRRYDIESHLVGVNSSVDSVFIPGSVAIAHIYRAKGNEAAMVYAVDSQHAARYPNTIKRRNTLFTAITRSRAWVRIVGSGDGMEEIKQEVQRVKEEAFALRFDVPTQEEIANLRHVHRSRGVQEEIQLARVSDALDDILKLVKSGVLDFNDLPVSLRTQFVRLVEEANGDD